MSRFCLEVKGKYACFTRPEMKVERVSYDVITPSAGRAIFESILWKPAIRWQVEKIEVLKPIKWLNIRRNEVGKKISTTSVIDVMKGKSSNLQLLIEDERQQRASLFLRDVAYRLYADFELQDDSKHIHNYSKSDTKPIGNENSYMKFAEMFNRRARKGQCFQQPYLGTRECAAYWRLVENSEHEKQAIQLKEDKPLGWMLYDLDYSNHNKPVPLFFNPTLKMDGSIDIPSIDSDEVRR